MNHAIESALLNVLRKAEQLVDLGVKVLEKKVDDIEKERRYEEMSEVPKRDP